MAQESSAKVKVKGINQICIVVKDVQKVVENYWNILGIGPWDIYTWEAPLVYDYKYHGKPAWARAKMALTQIGAVQLELMEHVDGATIYQDFLMEHGEGLNHMNFLVDDVDATAEILAKEGFPSVQSGRWEPREAKGAYNYIDIKPLRAIWESVHGRSIGAEPIRYPDTAEVSPAKVKVKAIAQVGIVVKNLEEVMKNYWNILGVGPWDILELVPPALHHQTYHGKPGDFTIRVAFAPTGQVQLGLLQPVSKDNIYSDFIAKYGEGLHHLLFTVDDINETTKIMNNEGFSTLMSGRVSDGGFAYYDTGHALKCIWEAFQIPKIMLATTSYP
ncbi:hypothetical protein ES703_16186 [subsurface metagenome]